jgi:hypothetical protein
VVGQGKKKAFRAWLCRQGPTADAAANNTRNRTVRTQRKAASGQHAQRLTGGGIAPRPIYRAVRVFTGVTRR